MDLIQEYKMINVICEINLEFEPALLPPLRGHRGHYERELIKDFIFSIILHHKTWSYLTNEIVFAILKNCFISKKQVRCLSLKKTQTVAICYIV